MLPARFCAAFLPLLHPRRDLRVRRDGGTYVNPNHYKYMKLR